MNSRQGSALAYEVSPRFMAGYVLVSVGILLSAAGGSWDITNHLLNKPETFFAPPHAVLYAGVGAAVAGAAMLFAASRRAGKVVWPVKLAIAGVILLISAGPVDFVWHSAFGLDGLLSPPHFVLVSGMVASSLGSLAGIALGRSVPAALIIVAVLPVWLASSGIIDMFSLPFSETDYFNFNPHPALGVAVATLGFPLLISAVLVGSSILADRRFGVMSAAGAAFIAINTMTSIIPNDSLVPTIPFIALNIIPIVAADAVMSFSRSKMSLYIAGALVGMSFLMLYYPLITHTYNEVLLQKDVWPSLTAPIYFEMLGTVFPLVAAPAIAMGILGAVAGHRIIASNKLL
jgi:hypothetical protein